MRRVALLIIAALLVGCGSSQIEMENGDRYVCEHIWGNSKTIYCYVGGQSFPIKQNEVKWFTTHTQRVP